MFRAMTFHITLSVTCVLAHLPHFRCHTMNDSRTLLATKLADYNTNFRPVANQSQSVGIYVGLELISIHEFDEVQEQLTITAFMSLYWIDEYINWNPDAYGGIDELVIESEKVWTPNVVLTNNVKQLKKIGDSWQIIRITSDGISAYFPGDVFAASCTVDITYYPWDKHRCRFSFSAWAHSSTEIYFHPSSDKVQKTYFSENGAWDFVDSNVETFDSNQYLDFYLHIERKPRFVVVNVIIPIVCMTFLNSVIFLIPTASGERISYGITVLLAIAVFFTLVGDNLPKSSSPMSIFGYYLMTILIISICITLANILSLRLYFRDDSEPVTGCWTGLVRCMKCNLSRHKIKDKDKRRNRVNSTSINGKRSDSNDTQQGHHQFNRFQKTELVSSVDVSSENHRRNNSDHERNGIPITHGGDYYLHAPERETSYRLPKTEQVSSVDVNSENHRRNNTDRGRNGIPITHGGDYYLRTPEGETSFIQTIQPSVFDTHANITWKDVSGALDTILFLVSVTASSTATIVFFSFIFGHRE